MASMLRPLARYVRGLMDSRSPRRLPGRASRTSSPRRIRRNRQPGKPKRPPAGSMSTTRVLSGCRAGPAPSIHSRSFSGATPACCRLRHGTAMSSAHRTIAKPGAAIIHSNG